MFMFNSLPFRRIRAYYDVDVDVEVIMKSKRIRPELILFSLFLLLIPWLSAQTVKNDNHPLKGEYQFPLEEIWTTTGSQELLFGLPVSIDVSENGMVYCRDLKNKIFFIFNADGKFQKTFGELGEAPGQVLDPGGTNVYTANQWVLLSDRNKIHYFSLDGKYSHSIVNNRVIRPISVLINENEYISAPSILQNVDKGNAQVKHVNVKTNKESVITDFMLFNSGVIAQNTPSGSIQASATIPTITPVMVVGMDRDRLYFGMNSAYIIYVSDMKGNPLGSFSLDVSVKSVSLKEREEVMKVLVKGQAPEAVALMIAKTLPDKETYFVNFYFRDDLIYVYRSHFPANNQQKIDVFNQKHQYLYSASVTLPKGSIILAGPHFKGNFCYLTWETDQGEIYLGNFKTSHPTM